MKNLFAFVAAAGLAATILTGCAPVAHDAREVRALVAIRDRFPQFRTVDDNTIIDEAKAACAAFDAGSTWPEYVRAAESSGVRASDAAVVAGFGFALYCPQHKDVALR